MTTDLEATLANFDRQQADDIGNQFVRLMRAECYYDMGDVDTGDCLSWIAKSNHIPSKMGWYMSAPGQGVATDRTTKDDLPEEFFRDIKVFSVFADLNRGYEGLVVDYWKYELTQAEKIKLLAEVGIDKGDF